MTEQEWNDGTDPAPMLAFLGSKASDRKLRLWTCACARRLWHLLADEPDRRAVEVAERYADGLASRGELEEARRAVVSANHRAADANELLAWGSPARLAWCTTRRQVVAAARDASNAEAWYAVNKPAAVRRGIVFWKMGGDLRGERGWQVDVLRDLFGKPFRPVQVDPAWPGWHGGAIPELAQSVYEERQLPGGYLDAARLAVLADMLEEAGCADAEILGHLRGPGPHVRGCWAVDCLKNS